MIDWLGGSPCAGNSTIARTLAAPSVVGHAGLPG